jgi:hypothetical protein
LRRIDVLGHQHVNLSGKRLQLKPQLIDDFVVARVFRQPANGGMRLLIRIDK